MARTRAPANLLGLVDSDSEDDLGGVPKGKASSKAKPASSIRDMPAAKRGRPAAAASAAASKVTKPAQKSAAARRAGERKGAAAAAAAAALEADDTDDTETTAARSRRVLADRTNELAGEGEQIEQPAAKGKARAGRKAVAAVVAEDPESDTEEAPVVPKKRGRGRPKATEEADKHEGTRDAKTTKRGGRAAVTADEAPDDVSMEDEASHQEPEIPEAQFVDSMEIETTEERGDVSTEDGPSTVQSSFQSPLRRSRPHHPPAPSPAVRARGATAASDSSAADASVRRRLGELTKKYDTLESRYRDLKEIGVKEAERNFDRLKKQGDDRVKVSNDLIASLKAELASYRELAKEGAKAKREWEASEARAADLQAQVGELKTALGDAKAEAKTLATKLAAARTAADVPSLPAGMAVPGSAMKSSSAGGGHGHHLPPATAASARAAVEAMHASSQVAQLKEDLYGDLTGLLVRSAKRDGGREMYDCIQTGRNGSLHFKLCIDDESSGAGAGGSGGGSGGGDADDAQFVYMPQLNPSRDAALIEMLPDYLVEEISFPRVQAAKFYKRVMQSLTEEL